MLHRDVHTNTRCVHSFGEVRLPFIRGVRLCLLLAWNPLWLSTYRYLLWSRLKKKHGCSMSWVCACLRVDVEVHEDGTESVACLGQACHSQYKQGWLNASAGLECCCGVAFSSSDARRRWWRSPVMMVATSIGVVVGLCVSLTVFRCVGMGWWIEWGKKKLFL
jgi:hypothetical protein